MKLTIQGHEIELTEQELEALRLQLADEAWANAVVRAVIVGNTKGVMGEPAPENEPTLANYLAAVAYRNGKRVREAHPGVVKQLEKAKKRHS